MAGKKDRAALFAVFNLCCRICVAYEHKVFTDGFHYGAQLMKELI